MELVPTKSFGPFVFDKPLPSGFLEQMRKVDAKEFGEFPWERYDYTAADGSEYSVYIENGVVDNVASDQQCVVNGRNLIGESICELERILGSAASPAGVVDLVSGPQEVFTFDDAGLQVWLEDGVVVTVQCSSAGG